MDQRVAETGGVTYFECTALDAEVQALIGKGFKFIATPTDERWLWHEPALHDSADNVVCLFWAGGNRKNPPWRRAPAAT